MYLFVEIDETAFPVVYTETGNRTALINNTFIQCNKYIRNQCSFVYASTDFITDVRQI